VSGRSRAKRSDISDGARGRRAVARNDSCLEIL